MPEIETREIRAKVPAEVLARARRRLGRRVTVSEVVRHGLAVVAGVDPDDYPVRPGRPWDKATVEQRRAATAIARAAKQTRPLAPHGTHAACLQHYRKGERPCEACRLAENAYQRANRARRAKRPTTPDGEAA